MNRPVVLITGALTGIGRAAALAFAKENARIAVSGRREEEGKKLVADICELGAEAEFILSDVRPEDDVRSLVDKTVARFGRLDVAVNSAGTEGKPGPVTEQSAESYAATFDTNVLGTLLSMKHELRVMLAQGSGSIINVSSTFGQTGGAGASVYVASKHAVEGLTKSAALEASGSGIRVNAVAPGPIDTGMLSRFTGSDERKAGLIAGVPLKRVGKPERSPSRSCFSHLTGRLSSRVRRSQSMVAKRLCDSYRIGSDGLEKAHIRCWACLSGATLETDRLGGQEDVLQRTGE
jgi:NAD(P)-dependent dehydrogenase (short-subunit alcohol dehydrogenase family)